jgi:hypothetical protein
MGLHYVSESFNAIYFGPKSAQDHDVPLIVWPHGGPHSAFTDDFRMEAALFALLGKMDSLCTADVDIGRGALQTW